MGTQPTTRVEQCVSPELAKPLARISVCSLFWDAGFKSIHCEVFVDPIDPQRTNASRRVDELMTNSTMKKDLASTVRKQYNLTTCTLDAGPSDGPALCKEAGRQRPSHTVSGRTDVKENLLSLSIEYIASNDEPPYAELDKTSQHSDGDRYTLGHSCHDFGVSSNPCSAAV